MIPKAAVLCMAPMVVTLVDGKGHARSHTIESGYYRHPWHGEPVWFSCCRDLDVFTQGRTHLVQAVMAVRQRVKERWGLAEPTDLPPAGCPEPFELDRHGARTLVKRPGPAWASAGAEGEDCSMRPKKPGGT